MTNRTEHISEWKRCTLCGAQRILKADGTFGACTLIGCKDPLHDCRAELGVLSEAKQTEPVKYSVASELEADEWDAEFRKSHVNWPFPPVSAQGSAPCDDCMPHEPSDPRCGCKCHIERPKEARELDASAWLVEKFGPYIEGFVYNDTSGKRWYLSDVLASYSSALRAQSGRARRGVQTVKTAEEVARKHWRTFFNDPAKTPQELIEGAIYDTVEECCKAVCENCRNGHELVPVDAVITSNGRPYWHRLSHTSALRTMCDATAIRSHFSVDTREEAKG